MTHFYRSIYEPSVVAALPPRQRKFVYRQYMHPLTIRLPVMLAKSGVWAAILLLGWRLGAFESMARFIFLMLAAFAMDECFRVLVLRQNKGRIVALVREHAADIAAAAEHGAPPNDGPARSPDNSEPTGGPPSVS